jgi:hypothetical protein
MRRRRAALTTLAAALACALLAASCGGPGNPLDIAVKEVPSDIVLGTPESGAPAPPPIPPGAPVLVGPGVPPSAFTSLVAPPTTARAANGAPTVTTTTAAPPPVACPATDPLAAPKREATSRAMQPPPEGVLPFRNEGTFSVSGANARSGTFAPSSTRTVANVRTTPTGFTYTVAETLNGTTSTVAYQVIPASSVPGDAGLYVTSIHSQDGAGATSQFDPPLPLKLAEFPLVPNNSVTAAGTDPRTATTVSWTTTVGQKRRVAACGTPLDAYVVELTSGRVDSPQTNVDFSVTYAIATQFGGLSIYDKRVITGREGLDQASRQITSTVAVDPGAR